VGAKTWNMLLTNARLPAVPTNPMPKILHVITRLDMGGSAQNTLLTCRELADAYQMVLVHGLARESGMRSADLNRLIRTAMIAAYREAIAFSAA
jgi:hypothetical protein